MDPEAHLRKSLAAIDGHALIAEFLKNGPVVEAVAGNCARVALWANSLREAEPDNLAVPFLFEMQRASHDVAALLAMSLYVPAAASMRSMGETALYYTYFRTHFSELATLASKPDFFVSKSEILEFHKTHSVKYRLVAKDVGFPGVFDVWYSRVSAIVHGQLPGAWGARQALADTAHNPTILADAVKTFSDGVDLVDLLLFLTAGGEFWDRFHHSAKRVLLKGMSAPRRVLLGLDGK
jgi:hypothetical protein